MLPQLAPIVPPLGPQVPSDKLYSPNQTVLALRKKNLSWTGEDFTILTTEGCFVCKCNGIPFSLHQKRTFTDIEGREIFTLSEKVPAFRKTWVGETPSGQGNFAIKRHIMICGSRNTVSFKNAADGRDVELEVRADWLHWKIEISWNGRPVAAVSRRPYDLSNRSFPIGITYFVTAAGNVDLSLIAAICIALDERGTQRRVGS